MKEFVLGFLVCLVISMIICFNIIMAAESQQHRLEIQLLKCENNIKE